jgi:hypothetical protein
VLTPAPLAHIRRCLLPSFERLPNHAGSHHHLLHLAEESEAGHDAGIQPHHRISNCACFNIQVGYVGILGHHLTDPYWGNQWTSPTATAPYASIVGQGGIAKITSTESASNYNGLQAVYRQRLTAGLELTANYTYSHSMTDNIGFYGVTTSGAANTISRMRTTPRANGVRPDRTLATTSP